MLRPDEENERHNHDLFLLNAAACSYGLAIMVLLIAALVEAEEVLTRLMEAIF